MITIKSLLNKIKWDKNLNPRHYFLYYYDRIEKSLKKIRFIDIKDVDDGFIVIDKDDKEIHIPLHRIRKVEENNNVVWERQK